MSLHLTSLLALSISSVILAIRAKHHFTTLVCGWCVAITFTTWMIR